MGCPCCVVYGPSKQLERERAERSRLEFEKLFEALILACNMVKLSGGDDTAFELP